MTSSPPDLPAGAPSPTRDPEQAPAPPSFRDRRLLWTALAGLLVLVLVAVGVYVVRQSDGDPEAGPGSGDGSGLPAGEWLSGASGVGAASGEFGTWRGRALEIGGQWVDTNEDMVYLWGLKEEWADWDGPLDIAIGAIGPGETWAEAAAGAYDERWRQSLTNLREERGDRSGTLYIRFAHESNGNWYQWSVDAGEAEDFRAGWQRFRALQQEIYPESQLVFNVNRESVGSGVDWRETFPGAEYVDVMSVDYYNQWPAATTAQEWADTLDDVDQYGAPKGLEEHRLFAESVGLPLAISEWSGNAEQGGSEAFMEGMYDYLGEHAGTGPGEILYEVLFNVEGYDGKFAVFGDDVRMPETAEAYRRLW
ncbi:glycosyl hydrolase [Trujillonella endophytica]|uniref:Glycosyl hydrolase family 26 n=1 Tax=Trujillonella endophytica TaxID=673521 RepID=A0A1H8W187_9ACTN|nr:glycosyl hydrolase [Trujillella endophytica]SEP21344.1 Glycosyl hydrolase family 26 [Trujillella endophytica]